MYAVMEGGGGMPLQPPVLPSWTPKLSPVLPCQTPQLSQVAFVHSTSPPLFSAVPCSTSLGPYPAYIKVT